MLQHAAGHEIELLPYLSIGFFCGCRESALAKLLWSDVNLTDGYVSVRASVSKTKKKRFPALPENARAWLALYFEKSGTPKPEERIMKAFTPATLKKARTRNYRAAGGVGQ
jgi:integrase